MPRLSISHRRCARRPIHSAGKRLRVGIREESAPPAWWRRSLRIAPATPPGPIGNGAPDCRSATNCVIASLRHPQLPGNLSLTVERNGQVPPAEPCSIPGSRIAPPACRRDNVMDTDTQTKAALWEHWRASERGISKPSTPSIVRTRSWTIPSQVNDSGAAQQSRPNVAGTLPIGTSPSSGS